MMISIQFTEPAESIPMAYEIRTEQGLLEKMAVPGWDHSDWKLSSALTESLYACLFDAAARQGAKTLYLPLLGEQDRMIPAHRSAEALWKAACRSDFTGRCVVEIAKYPSPAIRLPEYNLEDEFGLVFFERPRETLYVRVLGNGIPAPGVITTLAQGLGRDPVFSDPGRLKMSDGVFSNPEITYQSALKQSKDLATSLFSVMHDMFYAPEAFIMNFAGVTEKGNAVVILKMLSAAEVCGTGIPDGQCEAGSFLVCRLPEGRGGIHLTFPEQGETAMGASGTGKTLELTFFPGTERPEGIIENPSSDLTYLYQRIGTIVALDGRNRTAWLLHWNQRHWMEHSSVYEEYEWGETPGHPMRLLGGFKPPVFSG